MGPKIFLTGATGFIGGTVLDTLVNQHSDYEITVLLRNVPDNFALRYPDVKIVKGDYDSVATISAAASEANVVVHNGDSDHEASIKAIISGLLLRSSPSFLIHLGGTGIIADWQTPPHGELNPKIWSDIDDLEAIISLPDDALHRKVDKIIQSAGSAHATTLKTAIICPPDIYGTGKGPGRTESVYMAQFRSEIKDVGAAFYAGSGNNTRSWVHIDDLMTIYLRLVESAVAGGGSASWGKEGYYFASSQEASQIDVAKAAGKILHAHGLLDNDQPKQLPVAQVGEMLSSWGLKNLGLYMFASNSRSRADRAQTLLGYRPTAPSIWETMEADLLADQTAQAPRH